MDSPFLHRLKTNYDPTDSECQHIRRIISKTLEQKSRLDVEIAQLKATLEDLCLQQQKMDEYVKDHRTLISGILRLPAELTQRIFFWCLPRSRNSVMSAREAPMLLGRVCRAWRHISLSCPILWSSLHIHITPQLVLNEIQHQDYCDAVTAWLNRSGQTPLSISFMEDYRENWDTGNPGPFSRLLDVLLGFSHRWRHLSVRLGYHHFCTLERVTPAAIPLLEEFSFEVPRPWNPSHIFLLSSIPLLHSPSLHTLSVYNLNWPMPLTLPLHWERLTRLFVGSRMLDGARLGPDQAMSILRRCGNLIACTIDIAVGGDEPEHRDLDTNDTIVLPFLDHLGVHFKYSTGMEIIEYELHELFNYLDSPMLRSLDVTGVNRLLHRIPFIPVLERQAGRLESLSFDINTMYTEDLKDILPLLSGIKRLHVDALFPWSWRKGDNYPLNDSFLTILTPTPCSLTTSFCPLLEDINFRISPTSDIQDETILEFILARTSREFAGISRLTCVNMTLGMHLVGFRPALQPIIEQGLNVRIDYHDPAIFGPEPIFQPYNSRSLEVARYRDHWAPGFRAQYIDDNLEA